jgi:hypothetical protein
MNSLRIISNAAVTGDTLKKQCVIPLQIADRWIKRPALKAD